MIVAHRVAARPLPAGLVHDGVVVNPDGLAHELRALFAEHKLGKRVRVGLATPRTILRVIDLPPLDESDIRVALPMHARDRIPMPLESAVLDHQAVGLVDTPEGQRLRVIVVATERTGVDALLDALRQAGLRPEGIDLSVFAAMRAVAAAESPPRARFCTPSSETSSISRSRTAASATSPVRPPRASRSCSSGSPSSASARPRRPASCSASPRARSSGARTPRSSEPRRARLDAPRPALPTSSGPSCALRPSSSAPSQGRRSPPVSSPVPSHRCAGSSRR